MNRGRALLDAGVAGLRLWLILAASLYGVVAVLLFAVGVANSHISQGCLSCLCSS